MKKLALLPMSLLVLFTVVGCAGTTGGEQRGAVSLRTLIDVQAIARAKIKAPPSESCAPILSWYEDAYAINGQKRNMGTDVHNGLDMAAQVGTAVIAAAPGIVAASSYQSVSGNVVWIYHGQDLEGNQIYSYSAHLNNRRVVKGQYVKRGDLIGRSGRTGSGVGNEGSHLHFGIAVRDADQFKNDFEDLHDIESISPNFFIYPMSRTSHLSTLPAYFPKWIPSVDYGDKDWEDVKLLTGLTFPMSCETVR